MRGEPINLKNFKTVTGTFIFKNLKTGTFIIKWLVSVRKISIYFVICQFSNIKFKSLTFLLLGIYIYKFI